MNILNNYLPIISLVLTLIAVPSKTEQVVIHNHSQSTCTITSRSEGFWKVTSDLFFFSNGYKRPLTVKTDEKKELPRNSNLSVRLDNIKSLSIEAINGSLKNQKLVLIPKIKIFKSEKDSLVDANFIGIQLKLKRLPTQKTSGEKELYAYCTVEDNNYVIHIAERPTSEWQTQVMVIPWNTNNSTAFFDKNLLEFCDKVDYNEL